MGQRSQPRAGSLQFWPRKRAKRFFPSVNWKAVEGEGLLGVIAYKVGMSSALVKDTTPNSLSKEKKIFIPVSILEAPSMKIFSVRFYKNNLVIKDVLVSEDKELKRIVKLGKVDVKKVDEVKDYDDIRIIVYSLTRKAGIKKTPDIAEIALGGSLDEKLKFVKENLNKEISPADILKEASLVDVRGLTKGKGIQGPVKRFGIKLKSHKSEKGSRRPGSLGPWHPAHVTFRVAIAGQMGFFTRIQYNNKIVFIGKINEKDVNPKAGWKHYGKINSEYIILQGSIQGPQKRQLLLTLPLRKTRSQEKKKYEFLGLK